MKKTQHLLPHAAELLSQLGQNLRVARLRRKLSGEQVAERAGISRKTLWAIETGAPGVSIGACLQVLYILGLEQDLLKIAGDDVLGRKLYDAKLDVKSRAPKMKKQKSNKTEHK